MPPTMKRPLPTPAAVLAKLDTHGIDENDICIALKRVLVEGRHNEIVEAGRTFVGELEADVHDVLNLLRKHQQKLTARAGYHEIDRAVAATHRTALARFARMCADAASRFATAIEQAEVELRHDLSEGRSASARKDLEIADTALELFNSGTTLNTINLNALVADLRGRVSGLTYREFAVLLVLWQPLGRPWTSEYMVKEKELPSAAVSRVCNTLRQMKHASGKKCVADRPS